MNPHVAPIPLRDQKTPQVQFRAQPELQSLDQNARDGISARV